MATDTKKETIKSVRQRRYLNKEFDSFRQDLVEYARTFYGDKIVDLSEASMGGLLMDMPAYVGDVMSFYLDHQFSELDPETAVETANIERALRRSGVEITGASPAVATVYFFIEVPAASENGIIQPKSNTLPTIEAQTTCRAENGVEFQLIEDVDFSKRDSNGNLTTPYKIGQTTSSGVPLTFIMRGSGLCISGTDESETFSFSGFVPFRRITLSNSNVSQIVNVMDSLGNVYYKVNNLAEDVVYKEIPNMNMDHEIVESLLQLMPVPYRFTTEVSLEERATTLIFGGGSADTLEDDAVPDPSVFALPLYGKTTFPRLILNPQKLLDTKTLGVSSADTSVTVTYRYGGGTSHNVEPDSIRYVSTLIMSFPSNPPANIATAIRGSVTVSNAKKALGGLDASTPNELKELIPLVRNSQSRIVSKPDLVARVYTMPSNFGRVFRAAARSSPGNPLATQLYVICKDADDYLDMATDALKDNLRVFLNSYRMISDAIDIVDAKIINFRLLYEVTVDITMNKKQVLQQINTKLRKFFNIKNFHIDQPIVIGDIHNLIYNSIGVTSVNQIKLENLAGNIGGRQYSDVYHDIQAYTHKGASLPPGGGIFELKYPDDNIIGRAI